MKLERFENRKPLFRFRCGLRWAELRVMDRGYYLNW